jgi:hypothetical protein
MHAVDADQEHVTDAKVVVSAGHAAESRERQSAQRHRQT